MIIAVIVLSITSTLLAVGFTWAFVTSVRFGKMLLDIENTTEQVLDVIDMRYKAICTIASQNLVSHDPYVRQLVGHVEGLKKDILVIASRLTQAGTKK